MITLQQIDMTGGRLVGAITKLGHTGPKHHAIVLGKNPIDGKVYVAEKMAEGDQVATLDSFKARYQENGDINVYPNDGKFSDVEVARRALREIKAKDGGDYDLLGNNCESFSNRAIHDHSISSQVVSTVIGCLVLVGGVLILKKNKII